MIITLLKSKWTLFIGLTILLIGIATRILMPETGLGLILILIGVGLKASYIIVKARTGEYHPGVELLYLTVGLGLFLSGVYLKYHDPPFIPAFLMIPGIILKVFFIIIFIRKTKRSTKQ